MAVELKKVIDTRIDSAATLTATHDAVLGPSNLVRQTFRPTAASAGNLNFTIQTPGLAVYMSRKVMLSMTVPFTVVIRNYGKTAVYIRPGQNVGTCAFPGNSMISTADVQISTSSFTTQVQQTLPLVKRLLQRPEARRKLATSSTGLGDTLTIVPQDQSSYFQSVVATGIDPHGDMTYGNSTQYTVKINGYWNEYYGPGNPNNVVAPGGGGCTAAQWNEGGTALVQPVDTIVSGTMEVLEPLLCQPFELDDEQPAFINVNMISVRLALSALSAPLCRPIRFAAAPSISASTGAPGTDLPQWQPYSLRLDDATPNLFGSATLACNFFSPPPTAVVPTKSIYPTTFINPLSSILTNTVTSNDATVEFSSNVITLNTAPDAIAVYFVPEFNGDAPAGRASPVFPVSNASGLQLEDYVSAISALDVTWNNNPSLLRTFTAQELWQRSHENGMPQSYAMHLQGLRDNLFATTTGAGRPLWTGNNLDAWGSPLVVGSGVPVLLALNKDIPVEPGVAAGVAGVYTLQVKAYFRSSNPFIPTSRGSLYVVPIYSQYLILNAGATSDLLSTVATEEQVAATPASGEIQDKEMTGGSAQHILTRKLSAAGGGFVKGGAVSGGAVMGGAVMGGDSAGAGKRPRASMYM